VGISPSLLLSLGLTRNTLTPQEVYKPGSPFKLPDEKTATNGQAALFYDFTADTRFYASIAEKSRLPTIKDRYSARFATYSENTSLRPEASVNYEVGYQGSPWSGSKADAAIFYSDITDKIQTAYQPGSTACTASSLCQMQNIGKVQSSGIELGLNSAVTQALELGGNYTLTVLKNVSDPATKLTSIPRHKLTAHALYKVGDALDIIGFAESNSSRWASNTVELAGFTTLNLKAVYRANKAISTEVGVNNLSDHNYSLADGYPNPGRTWFANASYQF
jgi:iron complex outermembrane receptor protein